MENEFPQITDAIWASDDDIRELKKNFKEHVLMAHLSQPLGKPLHRYIGKLVINEDALIFYGKDKKAGEIVEKLIPKEKIIEIFLGWDETLIRWMDTRAWMPPLRVRFEEDSKQKTLYIYIKKEEGKIYGRENKKIFEKLKSAWKNVIFNR